MCGGGGEEGRLVNALPHRGPLADHQVPYLQCGGEKGMGESACMRMKQRQYRPAPLSHKRGTPAAAPRPPGAHQSVLLDEGECIRGAQLQQDGEGEVGPTLPLVQQRKQLPQVREGSRNSGR